jgi:hypothetical protein
MFNNQDFLFFDEFSAAPATHVVVETGVFWKSAVDGCCF